MPLPPGAAAAANDAVKTGGDILQELDRVVSTLAQGQPEQTPELERIRALGMEAVEKMRAVIDDMARGIEALASEAAPPDFIPPPEPEPEPSADDVNAQIAAIKERLNQETP